MAHSNRSRAAALAEATKDLRLKNLPQLPRQKREREKPKCSHCGTGSVVFNGLCLQCSYSIQKAKEKPAPPVAAVAAAAMDNEEPLGPLGFGNPNLHSTQMISMSVGLSKLWGQAL